MKLFNLFLVSLTLNILKRRGGVIDTFWEISVFWSMMLAGVCS